MIHDEVRWYRLYCRTILNDLWSPRTIDNINTSCPFEAGLEFYPIARDDHGPCTTVERGALGLGDAEGSELEIEKPGARKQHVRKQHVL